MTFQPQKPNPIFSTEEVDFTVSEAGIDPSTVINAGAPFAVNLTVHFAGAFASFIMAAGLQLSFTVAAEKIGAGFEGNLGTSTVNTVPAVFDYTGTVNVPAGLATRGTYLLTIAMMSRLVVPTPIAGFDQIMIDH
jgi:hypothetical protein